MKHRVLALICCAAASCSATWADQLLYGDNATFGSPYIYVMDATTGAIMNTITNLSSSNGRGAVVVGDNLYYTTASSPSVYSYNLTTSTNNGPLFTVAGSSALSTMAFDGTNFWIGDYSGTNHAYLYSPPRDLAEDCELS